MACIVPNEPDDLLITDELPPSPRKTGHPGPPRDRMWPEGQSGRLSGLRTEKTSVRSDGSRGAQSSIGNRMIGNKENLARTNPVPTDVEIESAVERLGPNWTRVVPRPRTGGATHILQGLARGRSHAVVLEIKRSYRRLSGSP
jgi:hypothetical protein